MKIEALTICVNYSDFLVHCIKANKQYFDKWVIVTDTKDQKTKDLCDEHGLICVQTDVFYEGGAKFRKYAGINEGIKHLDKDGWVLFIDGDIILSQWTRRVLEKRNLDPNKIYGIDRLNCFGYERWVEYQQGTPVLINNWLLQSSGLEWGARIVHIYGEEGENGLFTGWKPLGFFQLVHSSRLGDYPEGSDDASHGDLAFAKLWKPEEREFIPEIIGIHIYTESHKGSNWKGRRSDLFDYSRTVSKIERCWDNFLVKLNSICVPSYGPECFLCKIYNNLKNIVLWLKN